MNHPDDEHRELKQQLDEAGRLCRAEHPGWETLVERLPARAAVKQPRSRRRSSRWTAVAIAAGILIAIVLGFSLRPGPDRPALAETLPIEVRRLGIQVTIFSKSEVREPTLFMPLVASMQTTVTPRQNDQQCQMAVPQRGMAQNRAMQVDAQIGANMPNMSRVPTMQQSPGMALVKDQRMVLHLRKGDNLVKFTDVAASIDPTSVRLTSDTDPTGTKVVEQNFEFDLASADALLKRSIDEKITCVGKDGELFEGYLLCFDVRTIVLADKKPSDDPQAPRPKTQTISRRKLQAIRIEAMPGDLYTRPTLVWKLRADTPGDHLTTLTYLCGNAVWRADYVAVITGTSPEGDTLDLKGWVTIDNRSGATYENAGLKLIAGDGNRVRDPWAPQPPRLAWSLEQEGRRDPNDPASLSVRKELIQKSFFEYKLYTLSQPSTIKDRQIRQIGLFKATGIKALRRFVCRSGQRSNLHADVQLLIENEKQNNLGRPLPKGLVALTAVDADGDSQFLGRQQIDHTPKDEELEITMGRAFDVVYGYRIVETKRPARNRMIQTYEFRIRNHKPTAIRVRAIGTLAGYTNWSVRRSSDAFVKHDFQTLHFDFPLDPDTEKTITYTVDYRW